jgi:pimeloyl-ACP methyl ester carboxylesterase
MIKYIIAFENAGAGVVWHALTPLHQNFHRNTEKLVDPGRGCGLSTPLSSVLLLHGFPTSSHMFRNLIPELSGEYHVVAPDLPGFGFSDAPDHKTFAYTFEHCGR